jgi:hypothetical protein
MEVLPQLLWKMNHPENWLNNVPLVSLLPVGLLDETTFYKTLK